MSWEKLRPHYGNMDSKQRRIRFISGIRKSFRRDTFWDEWTLRSTAQMNRECFWNEGQPIQRYAHGESKNVSPKRFQPSSLAQRWSVLKQDINGGWHRHKVKNFESQKERFVFSWHQTGMLSTSNWKLCLNSFKQ